METHPNTRVVELRLSYRYVTANPWVVQAMGGFLSAYFMEQPEFRVQRHIEELESGMHVWVCDVPSTMNVNVLLKRLKKDLPAFHCAEAGTVSPAPSRFVIDCPQTP